MCKKLFFVFCFFKGTHTNTRHWKVSYISKNVQIAKACSWLAAILHCILKVRPSDSDLTQNPLSGGPPEKCTTWTFYGNTQLHGSISKITSGFFVLLFCSTIGKLEPSYVIRKFLDAQRIHNLTAYLQALHRQSLANADHTTLLLNCYTKLKDSSKLEEFIKVANQFRKC